MAIHHLEPEAGTTHGAFSPDLPPVLTIDPGDTVTYRVLEAGWAEHLSQPKLQPRKGIPANGHCLVGPVAVRGAEPGMTLVMRINRIDPGKWGNTYSGGWDFSVNRHFGLLGETNKLLAMWDLDWDPQTATGTGRVDLGYEVPLHPFFGVMGMPTSEPGWHSTAPPRITGGNLDCKELVAGSTLYLPIQCPGGLVSVGDGHAAQTDGEVSGTAIECPIQHAEITYDLLPDQPLPGPWAETPAGTLTFGLDADLNVASMQALEAMVSLLGSRFGMTTQQALIMASVAVDLRITQIVNGVQGVHALLPHGAIKRTAS